jgi:hypothetical protein
MIQRRERVLAFIMAYDGRLFIVLIIASAVGSTALLALALF